jgi:type IV secretory pathway VirB10-like protein
MALSKRNRNIIIAAVIAAVIIVIIVFMLGRGCAGEEGPGTTAGTTATARTATAATATTESTPTATASTQTTTTEAPPAPAPAPAPTPAPLPEIISRSVNPEVADPGDPLTFSSDVRGPAASVTITVYKRDTGDLALTLPLVQGATVGDVTTWSAGAAAPAVRGEYRYFAAATTADGIEVEMPGVSAWTFCVGDPAVDCS